MYLDKFWEDCEWGCFSYYIEYSESDVDVKGSMKCIFMKGSLCVSRVLFGLLLGSLKKEEDVISVNLSVSVMNEIVRFLFIDDVLGALFKREKEFDYFIYIVFRMFECFYVFLLDFWCFWIEILFFNGVSLYLFKINVIEFFDSSVRNGVVDEDEEMIFDDLFKEI